MRANDQYEPRRYLARMRLTPWMILAASRRWLESHATDHCRPVPAGLAHLPPRTVVLRPDEAVLKAIMRWLATQAPAGGYEVAGWYDVEVYDFRRDRNLVELYVTITDPRLFVAFAMAFGSDRAPPGTLIS